MPMKTLVIFSKVIKVSNVFNLTALFESETQNILRYPPYLLEKSMLLHALLFFLWEQEVIKEAKRLLEGLLFSAICAKSIIPNK